MRTSPAIHAVHVASIGRFGEAVASSLQSLSSDVIHTAIDPKRWHPSGWPTARVHVLASWRPSPAVSRVFDDMSHAWRTPFIEAVMDAPYLQVGPVVVPGVSACHGCAERRIRQHSPRSAEHKLLRDFYEANPQQGPEGFLPALADLAAVRVTQLVRALDADPSSVAGHIWRMHALRREATTAVVVGVHGCQRCGLGRDELSRGFVRLAPVVSQLLDVDQRLTARGQRPLLSVA
jgi:bacteriocin biosynthesis cyclodehydratase domain-containing protein